MKTVFRLSALAFVVSANVGISTAAYQQTSFGEYSTRVQENRLFVGEQVTTLRCDLFFSDAKSSEKLVAPKGSVVTQSVPAFVWQYSGLLPVSDYMKTVAIHSVGSEQKERSWQNVQQTFYNGLRAEGVRESDAKIAYAGAYAFAPRWPLVELIDITVPERDKETRLYKVQFTPAGEKGVSIEDYQLLARDILSSPERVSLQDIRGVVDAADAAVASGDKKSRLKSFFSLFSKDKDKSEVKDPVEDLFIDQAQADVVTQDNVLAANTAVEGETPEVEYAEVQYAEAEEPIEDLFISQPKAGMTTADMDVEALEEEAVEVLGIMNSEVEGVVVEIDLPMVESTLPAAESVPEMVRGDKPAVWKIMPDGSEMLVQ